MLPYEKLTIEEAVFNCYRNMRTDYEIILYLGKGGHPKIVNRNKLLKRWQLLTLRDLIIQSNTILSYRKKRKTDTYEYTGYIIEALKASNLSEKTKRVLWNKIYRKKDIIIEIQTTRDKYYAHLDLDYRSRVKPNSGIYDYGRVIFTVGSIIQRIYGTKKFQSALDEIESRDDYNLLEKFYD